ncbi:MAG: nitroreductase family protein, partial [Candidatus Thorarchaeota archaeon]
MTNKQDSDLFQSEEFFHVVEKRRSIRKFKEADIPQEHITRILDAARLAPSTNNTQPWRFIVVKEQATKELLTLTAGNQRFIADANAIIVAIADKEASCCPGNPSQWHVLDTMIAAEHVVLAATALGYGSCWIAML